MLVANLNHAANGPFVVRALDAGGGEIQLLVPTIGDYGWGSVLLSRRTAEIAALKIGTDGVWGVEVKDLG